MTKLEIVPTIAAETDKLGVEDTLAIGQWFWIDRKLLFALEQDIDVDAINDDEHGESSTRLSRRALACVDHLGTNYVEIFYAPTGGSERVHFDHWEFVSEHEADPTPFFDRKVEHYKGRVRELMDEVRRVTAQLGVTPRESIAAESDPSAQSQALAAASGVADIKAHKALLLQTKNETLPELFKEIEDAHASMARWMKAPLAPMKAQLGLMKTSIKAIEQRVFTVELYAGLVEELTLIQDGKPAPDDAKLHVFQRRHYMDEECLIRYEAGGMRFDGVPDFDKWLLRRENLTRILPYERSIVAFRIRHRDREAPQWGSIGEFIQFVNETEAERKTYLYIRNGERVYRLDTEIEFDQKLFPDSEHNVLLSGKDLWMKSGYCMGADDIIGDDEYQGALADYKREKAEHAAKVKAWKALPKKERKNSNEPWWHPNFEPNRWERVTPASVFYDDAIDVIQNITIKHNQIAVVLQGLLDRSPAFTPHPPWQLWRADGFLQAIVLIFDDSRAMTSGDPPDFETYRMQLAQSITTDSVVMGQEAIWERHQAEIENDRRGRSWRSSSREYQLKTFRPYGNPGPGEFAKPAKVTRTGKVTFEWTRTKQGEEWEPAERPGYLRLKPASRKSRIPCSFTVEKSKLFNVSAYTPGDFHLFYDDPRTRANYLKWAPYLLAAEDFHAGKRELGNDYEIKQRKGEGADE